MERETAAPRPGSHTRQQNFHSDRRGPWAGGVFSCLRGKGMRHLLRRLYVPP